MNELEASKLRDLEGELISHSITMELLGAYKYMITRREQHDLLQCYGEMRGLRMALDISCYRHGKTRYMKIADWLIERGMKNGW